MWNSQAECSLFFLFACWWFLLFCFVVFDSLVLVLLFKKKECSRNLNTLPPCLIYSLDPSYKVDQNLCKKVFKKKWKQQTNKQQFDNSDRYKWGSHCQFWEAFAFTTWYLCITRHLVVSFKLISFLDLPLGKRIEKGKKIKTELSILTVTWVYSQRQVEKKSEKRFSSDCVVPLPEMLYTEYETSVWDI